MSFFYSIKEGFAGIGRAKLPASVTIATGFFSLLLLGLFGTVSFSFYQLIHEVRSRVELEVFFDDRTGDLQADSLTERMKAITGIAKTRFISRNEAASRFARDFGADVVGILGMNPLPRSVEVSIQPGYAAPDSIAHIEKQIAALDGGLDIRYNKEYLRGIERNARLFTLITAGVGGVIALATIILNAFTVQLAMYARRDRIKTMRLVGATRWFISAPFLFEGIIQGLVSGGLAALGLWLIFEQALLRYEPAIYQILHPSTYVIYPGLVLLGIVLGFFGSTWSVARFLRVS
ncbi:ABC transporter permease [Chlorobaculum sp. MV4-Y]|jgi:cell division transport system permease protein|uniref:cell division protein FtsX n=1 Tax=Chlorobaculum sp. MV4-Y TaxID=2976335 RepID=UPI0021AF5BD5|nr:ABC transporter permease [Chlorobaculum sp. MV4-Y]UWX57950.1 ABC transporter permease [Chlorobaculum sp. MV4-Y]